METTIHRVNKTITFGVTLFAFLTMASFVSDSEAELWELVVDMEIEKAVIHSGQTVKASGIAVDHAYQPISEAEVLVRTGADTMKTQTNSEGEFTVEFTDFKRVSGTYIINAVVSADGKIGMTSKEFKVLGESSPVLSLQEKLSTEEARKYIASSHDDFEHDPVGMMLFKHYHGLLEELVEEKKKERIKVKEQMKLVENKVIVDRIKQDDIEKSNIGAGLYDGAKYEQYMNKLNPEIRKTIDVQLNFTKEIFLGAQAIKNEILANGGTFEEARKAYLEKMSISKETLEEFNRIDEKSQ